MTKDFDNINEKLLLEDERIAQYLKGKMTADEEQAFMRELATNADLKEKAIAIARMVRGMKEVGTANDEELVGELLAADVEEVKTIANNVSVTKKKGKVISWRRTMTWLSAAASVALLIWAGIGYNDYRTTTGLGNQYATEFTASQLPRSALTRGGETPTEVEVKLTKLFDNVVNDKDLEATVHDLSLCWELSMQETYNDYTDYAPEIGWNLAIGHLKNNDRKQAKAVLEKLTTIAPSGNAVGDKARELLKRVDEI